jgi:hypothetical protein
VAVSATTRKGCIGARPNGTGSRATGVSLAGASTFLEVQPREPKSPQNARARPVGRYPEIGGNNLAYPYHKEWRGKVQRVRGDRARRHGSFSRRSSLPRPASPIVTPSAAVPIQGCTGRLTKSQASTTRDSDLQRPAQPVRLLRYTSSLQIPLSSARYRTRHTSSRAHRATARHVLRASRAVAEDIASASAYELCAGSSQPDFRKP